MMKKTFWLASGLALFAACAEPESSYRATPNQAQQSDQKKASPILEADEKAEPVIETEAPLADKKNDKPAADTKKPDEAKAVRNSKGSGGGTGLLEVPFTDSTGLASSYKINAPADTGQKIYGLHIHLHGDGGGGYTDFPNKDLRYNLIGVTIKAPNANLQWGRTAGRPHARYVNELIQNELLKKYDIDMDKIFFSTVSGGSYFFMGSFLPEFGQVYNSAAFVMCGSEPPRVAFTDPKVLATFRVHIEVTAGERQDITASIQSTVTAYKNAMNAAGIPAADQAKIQTLNVEGAGGHCVFDGVSYTSGIQQAIDNKFKNVLPVAL